MYWRLMKMINSIIEMVQLDVLNLTGWWNHTLSNLTKQLFVRKTVGKSCNWKADFGTSWFTKFLQLFLYKGSVWVPRRRGDGPVHRVSLHHSREGCANPSRTMAHCTNIIAPKVIGFNWATRASRTSSTRGSTANISNGEKWPEISVAHLPSLLRGHCHVM